jgi:hypothetical protein
MKRYHVFAGSHKTAPRNQGWYAQLQSFDDLESARHHAVICPFDWAYVVDMETEKICVSYAQVVEMRRSGK